MYFENEIIEAIVGMSLSFGIWIGGTFLWIRMADWWKGDK